MTHKKTKKNTASEPTFTLAIAKFTLYMRSFSSSYKVIATLLNARTKESLKRLESLSKKTKKGRLKIAPKDIPKLELYTDTLFSSFIATGAVPRSLFVSMVSQFDTFLFDLMSAIYSTKPEILKQSNKALKPGILLKFKKIEKARAHLIRKQIEDILRESHLEHLKWLEKTLKIQLTEELGGLDRYIEITERRNLFAHADGIVNDQYISVCKKNSVALSTKIKEGYRLVVTEKYFFESYDYLYELAVLLVFMVWRKLCPKEHENISSFMNQVTFELLKEKRYNLVIKILEYFYKTKPLLETDFLMALVNLSLAYKFSGDKKKALNLINSVDWEAKNYTFQLAASVIEGKYDEAARLMKLVDKKVIGKAEYVGFPLFKEFIKTKYFLNAYKTIFKEKFVSRDIKKDIKKEFPIITI